MFEIGATLRQAREKKRIGLDQVEADTKIRARYLRALEDEDFDLVPGPTYVRGFLRTYAHYLGLDGQLFVDEYNSRFFDPFREEPYALRRSLPRRDRRREQRRSHAVLIALAAIVAVAVLVIVAATYPRQSSDVPITSQPPPTTSGPGNPQLPGAVTVPQTTTSAPAKVVRLSVRATASAVLTTVREGRGDGGKQLLNDVLDPATGSAVRGPWRSPQGFTVEVAAEGDLVLVVNGKRHALRTGTRFYVSPNGDVAPLK
jgi:cytoskeletal protein RodZ